MDFRFEGGSGFSRAAGLIDMFNARLGEMAGGNFPQVAGNGVPYLVAPALEQQAGIAGVLLAAEGNFWGLSQ